MINSSNGPSSRFHAKSVVEILFSRIELQLRAEKEDLRIQLSDLKRAKEEDERILKTTPTMEDIDAGDEEVKSSRSGVSIDDNADEEKEEFQGQLQVRTN